MNSKKIIALTIATLVFSINAQGSVEQLKQELEQLNRSLYHLQGTLNHLSQNGLIPLEVKLKELSNPRAKNPFPDPNPVKKPAPQVKPKPNFRSTNESQFLQECSEIAAVWKPNQKMSSLEDGLKLEKLLDTFFINYCSNSKKDDLKKLSQTLSTNAEFQIVMPLFNATDHGSLVVHIQTPFQSLENKYSLISTINKIRKVIDTPEVTILPIGENPIEEIKNYIVFDLKKDFEKDINKLDFLHNKIYTLGRKEYGGILENLLSHIKTYLHFLPNKCLLEADGLEPRSNFFNQNDVVTKSLIQTLSNRENIYNHILDIKIHILIRIKYVILENQVLLNKGGIRPSPKEFPSDIDALEKKWNANPNNTDNWFSLFNKNNESFKKLITKKNSQNFSPEGSFKEADFKKNIESLFQEENLLLNISDLNPDLDSRIDDCFYSPTHISTYFDDKLLQENFTHINNLSQKFISIFTKQQKTDNDESNKTILRNAESIRSDLFRTINKVISGYFILDFIKQTRKHPISKEFEELLDNNSALFTSKKERPIVQKILISPSHEIEKLNALLKDILAAISNLINRFNVQKALSKKKYEEFFNDFWEDELNKLKAHVQKIRENHEKLGGVAQSIEELTTFITRIALPECQKPIEYPELYPPLHFFKLLLPLAQDQNIIALIGNTRIKELLQNVTKLYDDINIQSTNLRDPADLVNNTNTFTLLKKKLN